MELEPHTSLQAEAKRSVISSQYINNRSSKLTYANLRAITASMWLASYIIPLKRLLQTENYVSHLLILKNELTRVHLDTETCLTCSLLLPCATDPCAAWTKVHNII